MGSSSSTPAASPAPTEPVRNVAPFTNLQDAVVLLDSLLAAGDVSAIHDLCLEPSSSDDYIHELAATYLPLAPKYAGRTFPVDGDTSFTLGGHESELGHINIVFEKKKKSNEWVISQIFKCR